ncbi:MAG TPA: HEAT repeat domain-containing protein [Anaeromyxobacteraceae bacterium]|nr:HEAT repeat domain-containing protein [Anaeromyxobacteraceae bacterium]
MTADAAARHARARHPDDETRYRAVAELDAARAEDLAVLLERLDDPSWRVRSAAVDRIGAMAEPGPALEALLALLSGGPSVGSREGSAAALVRIGRLAVAPLVERLGAEEADLRQASAWVLGQIGDRRTVPALAARLADGDPNVRAAAAEALARVGGGEAAGALLAALDSDDETLRLGAVEGLALLGVPPPADRLAGFLASPVLRRPAYRLLGSSDEPAALALLGAGLGEPVRRIREAALGAVGRQRDRRGAEELAPLARAARLTAAREPGLGEACARALASEEPFVAAGALSVLAWIGDGRHAGAVARAAEVERLRPFVEEALDAFPPGPQMLEAVSQAMAHLSPVARLPALAVLARGGNATAAGILVESATDPDPAVQAEAIAALGRVGSAWAVAPLAGLLDDASPGPAGLAATALLRLAGQSEEARATVLAAVRRRAGAAPSAGLYRVVGAAGEEEDAAILAAGLRSESAAHRAEAAAAHGALAARGRIAEAPAVLVGALGDPAWSVRSAAAHAVGELAASAADGRLGARAGGARASCGPALPALAGLLRDPEPAVRARAVEALGACGRREHAAEMGELAGDPGTPPGVAVAALRALATLGEIPAEVVARASAHPDPEVVKEAVALAARVPGAEGIRLLSAAAGHDRWDVRGVAARAMAARRDPSLRDEAARRAASDPDPFVARAFADAAAALSRR